MVPLALIPRACVPRLFGTSIMVTVYEAAWAAIRVLSRTLRDSTADSRERRMGGPLSVEGGRWKREKEGGAGEPDGGGRKKRVAAGGGGGGGGRVAPPPPPAYGQGG